MWPLVFGHMCVVVMCVVAILCVCCVCGGPPVVFAADGVVVVCAGVVVSVLCRSFVCLCAFVSLRESIYTPYSMHSLFSEFFKEFSGGILCVRLFGGHLGSVL